MVCRNFRFLQFDLKLEKKKTQFTRGRFNFWSEEFAWFKENTGKSWCKDLKTSNWKLLSNKNCYGQVQLKFHQSISPLAMFIGKCKVHIFWEGHKIYELYIFFQGIGQVYMIFIIPRKDLYKDRSNFFNTGRPQYLYL